MWDDPVVKEVREAGKRLQEKCNNDIGLFSEMITKGTEKLRKEGWTVVGKNELETVDISKLQTV